MIPTSFKISTILKLLPMLSETTSDQQNEKFYPSTKWFDTMKRHFSDQNISKHWLVMFFSLTNFKKQTYASISAIQFRYSQFLLGLCNRVQCILSTRQLVSLLYIQKTFFFSNLFSKEKARK